MSVAPEDIAEILDEREVPRIGADTEEDWRFVVAPGPEDETPDPREIDDRDLLIGSAEGEDAATSEPTDEPFGEPPAAGVAAPVRGSAVSRPSDSTRPHPRKTVEANIRPGTDDAPPTTPGHGNSGRPSGGSAPSRPPPGNRSPRQGGTKGDSRQKGRYLTYVAPTGGSEAVERGNPRDTEPSESEAHDIGAAAVRIALDFETQHGRKPKEMPHHNPGYDVISESPTGELRYIEVKGIDGAWGERGVALSHTQFKFAQLRSGEAWLYVVEHARGPLKPVVHPIQAPATKVMQFFFDAGWKSVAKEAADSFNMAPPTTGDQIMIEHGEVVEVAGIELIGDLIRIEVRDVDGTVRKVIWQPGSHTIIRRDDLGEDDPSAA